MVFRNAEKRDIPFIVETIIEAEKSGTSILTYSTIMGFSEAEASEILVSILKEALEPCELSLQSFFVAELNNTLAGACSLWLESESEMPSGLIKANALRSFLKEVNYSHMYNARLITQSMQIPHTGGCFQVGVVYTKQEFRGMGVASRLIDFALSRLKGAGLIADLAEVQVFANNTAAIKAYEKLGFRTSFIKEGVPEASEYFPSNKKHLMTLNIKNGKRENS